MSSIKSVSIEGIDWHDARTFRTTTNWVPSLGGGIIYYIVNLFMCVVRLVSVRDGGV